MVDIDYFVYIFMKTFTIIGLALLAGSISASAQDSEKTFQVVVENPWQTEK